MAEKRKGTPQDGSGLGGGETQQVHGRPLTPVQARLYAVLTDAMSPLSAYQLLDCLNDGQAGAGMARPTRRVYPQTVYRALASLQQQGLVHRVESTNAYLPCRAPMRPHRGIHLLCDRCGSAQEVIDARVSRSLDVDAEQRHFHIARQVVELHGVCAACLQSEAC